LISNLAVFAMEKFEQVDEVRIWDGGLPADPKPPFNYKLFFNAAGLVNEYSGDALYLRDGRITKVPALDPAEYQLVDIPELGKLEAFPTSGALSTMVMTFHGTLKVLENRTLRYPGHFELLRSLAELGLFTDGELEFEGTPTPAWKVAEKLFAEAFRPGPGEHDLMVVRVEAKGVVGERPASVTVDLLDRFDQETGFAAMERTTGFHLAVVAAAIARGEVDAGAVPLELAIRSGEVVEALRIRGIDTKFEVV
jgi:lysine 6-dehydrogenase